LQQLTAAADFWNPTGSLLAVRVGELGWAFAMEIDRPPRRRLVEHLGRATPEELEQVDNAIRAVFEV
jgi:mRNA-degrading endonuclease toxin of MazEF toxin-antitoxin module